MIIGGALADEKGEPVWPTFELLTGGHYFTYRGDDDIFLGKIAKVDFADFMKFCEELEKDPVEHDFLDDTKDGGY